MPKKVTSTVKSKERVETRELDEKIESVELGLRRLVTKRLDQDPSLVPSHIEERIQEQIQRALKANATLTEADFESLQSRLEYSDVRHLQDIITNKSLWARFAETYGSKPALELKFAQFAALRNAIRHSRSVDEIAKMEGEAAILWFEKTTAKAEMES